MALLGHKSTTQSRLNTSSNIGRDKSFVDDLNKERGIVRMRVAFVPRSAEIQPSIWRFVTFIPPLHNLTYWFLLSFPLLKLMIYFIFFIFWRETESGAAA
jgi:hypothetical protein